MDNIKEYTSEKEVNNFFVDRFKEENFITIDGLERFRKKEKIRIFSYVKKRIIEHLKDGSWENLKYLHLPIDEKEDYQKMVYFSLVKKTSEIEHSIYCYKEITKERFYKAMEKIMKKQEKEIKKLTKSGLPF